MQERSNFDVLCGDIFEKFCIKNGNFNTFITIVSPLALWLATYVYVHFMK